VRTLASVVAPFVGAVRARTRARTAAGVPPYSVGESISASGRAARRPHRLRGEPRRVVQVEGQVRACVNLPTGAAAWARRRALLLFRASTAVSCSTPRVSSPVEIRICHTVDGARIHRDPFSDETLARAIRQGIGAEANR